MTQDSDPLGIVGTTIDKYDVEKVVGRGGFAVVYRARHTVWDEPVALKFMTILQDAPENRREQMVNDFVQEGKLMAQLSTRSAAIVQARDVGKLELDGEVYPYMALEWLEGLQLDDVLRAETKQGLPNRSVVEAFQLLLPVLEGLAVAHKEQIAHRDLKPANIMIIGDARGAKPTVKVLDFGIAKVMESQVALQEQLELTGAHVTAFTPKYGAPEQFSRSHGATGPWTDVYATALVLVEVASGRCAFNMETFYEVGAATCDPEKRPSPRGQGLHVADAVEDAFLRALAVDPASRTKNMTEFIEDMSRAVAISTAPVNPASFATTVALSDAAPGSPAGGIEAHTANPVSAPITPPALERSPLVWLGGLALLAGIGAAVVVLDPFGVAAAPGPATSSAPVASQESPGTEPSRAEPSATGVESASASASATEAPAPSASAIEVKQVKPPPAPIKPRPVPKKAQPRPAQPKKPIDAYDPNQFGR